MCRKSMAVTATMVMDITVVMAAMATTEKRKRRNKSKTDITELVVKWGLSSSEILLDQA